MRLALGILVLLAGAAGAQPVRKALSPADTLVPRDALIIPLWPGRAPGAGQVLSVAWM